MSLALAVDESLKPVVEELTERVGELSIDSKQILRSVNKLNEHAKKNEEFQIYTRNVLTEILKKLDSGAGTPSPFTSNKRKRILAAEESIIESSVFEVHSHNSAAQADVIILNDDFVNRDIALNSEENLMSVTSVKENQAAIATSLANKFFLAQFQSSKFIIQDMKMDVSDVVRGLIEHK